MGATGIVHMKEHNNLYFSGTMLPANSKSLPKMPNFIE